MRLPARSRVLSSVFVPALVLVTACAHVPKRSPLPMEHVEDAEVLGIPRVRMWGDEAPPWDHDWFEKSRGEMKERYSGIYGRRHTYLAISGGGENGAFAAGLLLGWTASGTRPEFTAVTGVSAGALVAPFAFLGPEYDDVLKVVSAELSPDDVYKKRGMIRALRTDALRTTEPLQALIAKYVDEEVMEKIAAEHRKGRSLNIGTANLDSMRPVIWRIGAIANSGHPDALKLIRRVLLASASIPGVFTPVLIEVEAGDEQYDELHVDGGAAAQVFLYPAGIDYDETLERLEVPGRPKVYIIRNSRLDPMYEQVRNKIFPIAGRSLESLIRTQGIGDLYRIYLQTCRDGLDFNLAYIPSDFTEEPEEDFDSQYMKDLFNLAFDQAKAGYGWEKMPPELETAPVHCQ
ncbi:MAG: patatin-like phospholipase family protein [Deltaproteobacteria bacterium]|nr:patatin-like phospholipase family protein [Deltaproteobacteria bacterium]MBW2404066.1 patatin-like phospholipase family protein [Deltaproteobacteria bacterium]MBW2548504.1 patatin-like phospholipase family protein [Deltaproteobacteria bacterium]MBW2718445.1 patatin-like phospholipase family protein [Deltaproteobacteria bacterium]